MPEFFDWFWSNAILIYLPHTWKWLFLFITKFARLNNGFSAYWLKLLFNFLNQKYTLAYLPYRQVINGWIGFSSRLAVTSNCHCSRISVCHYFYMLLFKRQTLVDWSRLSSGGSYIYNWQLYYNSLYYYPALEFGFN